MSNITVEDMVGYLVDRVKFDEHGMPSSLWAESIQASNQDLLEILRNHGNASEEDRKFFFTAACWEMHHPKNDSLREYLHKEMYGRDRFGGSI